MGNSEKHAKKSKKKHKHKHKKEHKEKRHNKKEAKRKNSEPKSDAEEDFTVPIALMSSKSHAPETQAEYEHRQSQIRREVDPVTGRIRLIKGDSEILEEIVTRDRHKEINKAATRGDGNFFENEVLHAAKKKRTN